MRSPGRLPPLLLAFTLAGALSCADATDPGSLPPDVGVSDPTFARPFDGDRPLSNVFDHDLPFPYTDTHDGILAFWGERIGGITGHAGWDWPMPEGTPLLAVADGRVVSAGAEPRWYCPLLEDTVSGLGVAVEHTTPGGRTVRVSYAHLSRIDVSVGQTLRRGRQVGLSGNTGCSTGPHLHFAARTVPPGGGNAIAVDPYGWGASGDDPWSLDPRGTASVYLWLGGEAPAVFDEFAYPAVAGTLPVYVNTLRFLGGGDLRDTNREYFDITLNPSAQLAAGGSFDLGSLQMRTDSVTVTFPAGAALTASRSTVWVYSGSGVNTSGAIHLGRATPLWPNRRGCALLTFPGRGYLQYQYGDSGYWYAYHNGTPTGVCPEVGAGARLVVANRPRDATPPAR